MDSKITEIATRIVLAGFALIVLGSCAVPAVMAYVLNWKCILIYPVVLVLILLAAASAKK